MTMATAVFVGSASAPAHAAGGSASASAGEGEGEGVAEAEGEPLALAEPEGVLLRDALLLPDAETLCDPDEGEIDVLEMVDGSGQLFVDYWSGQQPRTHS